MIPTASRRHEFSVTSLGSVRSLEVYIETRQDETNRDEIKSYQCTMSRDNKEITTIAAVSFVAGAATASCFVWWQMNRRYQQGINSEKSVSISVSISEQQQQQHWIEPILNMTVEELKAKIGELPEISRSNMRWPWEKIRKQLFAKTQNQQEHEPLFTSPVKPHDKTGLCIGSIFGLDVGGTLAKLVYFEDRHLEHPQQYNSTKVNPIHRRTSTDDIWKTVQGQTTKEESSFHHQHSMPDLLPPSLNTTQNPSQRHQSSRGMVEVSKSHAEALGQFYNFARNVDTYQTGVKDSHLSFYSRELGGDFHFIRFETRHMHSAMDLIRSHNLHLNIREMGATGGGAHKFANDWDRVLGIEILKQEELDSMVAGMQFVISTVVGECYTFRPRIRESTCSTDTTDPNEPLQQQEENNERIPSDEDSDHDAEDKDEYHGDDWWWSRKVQRDVVSVSETYPYLLVTIGTGVSILRVDGPREHERISGSTIGGGTYWGLIRLLTDTDDFEAVMKLAEQGDPSKVDMMVGDIYGNNSDALEKIGLPSNLVASSFGKLVAKQDPAVGLKQEDLARALLLMVTNNIGQVAYLNAKLHKTPRIYFIGNFLRGNKLSQRRLAYAINYWSKGEMEALFLEHEGYFGALGAFLLSQGISHGETGFFQWDKSQSSKSPLPAMSNTVQPEKSAGKKHKRSETTG